jgi:beta-lactamase superfamily II metal-dependent hydrolase
MIIFEAIDAGHGDAILVRYHGNAGFERIILVDGGPKSANNGRGTAYVPYETRVIPRLMEIKRDRDAKKKTEDIRAGQPVLSLDLVVCTHIDDDHIAGIERLYGCLSGNGACAEDGDKVEAKRLWFNSFSALLGEAVDIGAAVLGEATDAFVVSVNQGENLTSYALRSRSSVNEDAPGLLIAAGQTPKGFLPAKVSVVAPGTKALEKLRKDWLEAVRAKAKKKKKAAEPAAAGLDAARFRADQSVPNLSSIVLLIEGFGRRILLTGDQRGDRVLQGLISAGRMKPGGTFHVDIMKVPHHGSTANVQPKFIDAVPADTYVFSANGKDQNPDTAVLALVANEARKGRKFTMAFTNGDLVYAKDKRGELPKIGNKTVATLTEAITELKKDADVRANVSFVFRDPAEHSLVMPLEAKAE